MLVSREALKLVDIRRSGVSLGIMQIKNGIVLLVLAIGDKNLGVWIQSKNYVVRLNWILAGLWIQKV